MQKYLVLIIIVYAATVSNAQNMSWMQTARMQRKGCLELLPTAMGFSDPGAFRPGWGVNYGLQVTYGVNDRINLTFRNSPYTYFMESEETTSFSYLGVGTKLNLVEDKFSILIPLGINISEYFNVQTDVKMYLTKTFANNISLSLCPTIDALLGVSSNLGLGTDLNVTFPLLTEGNNLVFETGYYIWLESDRGVYAFAGIGFQFEYWKNGNE